MAKEKPPDYDWHAHFASLSFATVDRFRQYHLSSEKTRVEGEQGRKIEGPQDDFERRRMEKDLGRVYVGDEIGGMSKLAQRGIEKVREKKRPAKVILS